MKDLKKVEIEWVDSVHDSGWVWNSDFDIKDFEKEMTLHKTAGYLLKSTKNAYIVIQSYRLGRKDIIHDARMAIPKKVVTRFKRL